MFTIYKGAKKIGQTADTSFLVDGLSPDTEYTLGVSRTVDGVESAVTKVKARTDKEVEVPQPHNLTVVDKGDTHITVKWDSDVPIGQGVYNLYLDNEPVAQDLRVREYTINKLKPSTEYKICLCGVDANGKETPKVTVYETTEAEIGENEPPAPTDLTNLIKNGSYELFSGRFPDHFENAREIATGEESTDLLAEANKEWKVDGEQSLTIAVNPKADDSVQILVQRIKVMPGYYVAALEYNMPEPVEIESSGTETKYKHELVLHALNHSQSTFGGAGIMQIATSVSGIQEIEMVVNTYISDYGSVWDAKASIDALRLYKVDKAMHDYIKAGKMTDARFREVFPYKDAGTVAPVDVSTYHVGGGYYDIDGERVRGKEAAQNLLESKEVKK